MKNSDPILNFRLSQGEDLISITDSVYSVGTGIHSTSEGKKPAPVRFGHMTLITETREASDTSEYA